jgi:hypothetical protein
MPFPKVQHACEDAVEMGKSNGCFKACKIGGGSEAHCNDQRNERPKPLMYKACITGLKTGEQWAKVEYRKRYPATGNVVAKPKKRASGKIPITKALKVLSKKYRKKPKKAPKIQPVRASFRDWWANVRKQKVSDLLKAGNIDADKTAALQQKRVEDTYVTFTENGLTAAKLKAANIVELKNWNGLLQYPLTYDGENGDPLEASDLREQLEEVLPLMEILGAIKGVTKDDSEAEI